MRISDNWGGFLDGGDGLFCGWFFGCGWFGCGLITMSQNEGVQNGSD